MGCGLPFGKVAGFWFGFRSGWLAFGGVCLWSCLSGCCGIGCGLPFGKVAAGWFGLTSGLFGWFGLAPGCMGC